MEGLSAALPSAASRQQQLAHGFLAPQGCEGLRGEELEGFADMAIDLDFLRER